MNKTIFFVVGRHGDKIAEDGFPRGGFADYNDINHVHITLESMKDFRVKGQVLFQSFVPSIVDGYNSHAIRAKESIENITIGANISDKLILHEKPELIVGDEAIHEFRSFGRILKESNNDWNTYTHQLITKHYFGHSGYGFSLAKEMYKNLIVFKDAIESAINNNSSDYENPAIILIGHNPFIEGFNIIFEKRLHDFYGTSKINVNKFNILQMGDLYSGSITVTGSDYTIEAVRSDFSKIHKITKSELEDKIAILHFHSLS